MVTHVQVQARLDLGAGARLALLDTALRLMQQVANLVQNTLKSLDLAACLRSPYL
jgi:hypothetical protein